MDDPFKVPTYFDYVATLFWAVRGAMIGAHRGYDISGVFALALVSSTGGGLLRDGLFLQNGPPLLLQTPVYLLIVAAATLLVFVFGSRIRNAPPFLRNHIAEYIDAIGLGAYAVVGMQLSLALGLSLPGVVLVGVVNAVGGGVLRDVITRQRVELFKPGKLTGIAALCGCFFYLTLVKGLLLTPNVSGWLTIFAVFTLRLISVHFDLRTQTLPGFTPDDSNDGGS